MTDTTENKANHRPSKSALSNLVMPDSVTLSESGSVLTEHHDGFDYPGELTFNCVNNFVHDADRHFEELQYLALGMIGELEEERSKTKALEYELGQTRIMLENKTTLLSSCEKALEERDAAQYKG